MCASIIVYLHLVVVESILVQARGLRPDAPDSFAQWGFQWISPEFKKTSSLTLYVNEYPMR